MGASLADTPTDLFLLAPLKNNTIANVFMNQNSYLNSEKKEKESRNEAWVVGIDPGMKGGIAAINLNRSESKVWSMPTLAGRVDTTEMRLIFDEIAKSGQISLCVLEKAQSMPRQGVVGVFSMGVNYGILLGTLVAAKVPFDEITPSEWKRAIIGGVKITKRKATQEAISLESSVDSKKAQRAADKKALKEVAVLTARRLFPDAVFRNTQDGIAEALLMAEAARRIVVSGSLRIGDV